MDARVTFAGLALVAACGVSPPAGELPSNRVGPAAKTSGADRPAGTKMVFARLEDASGLPLGTEVRVAGLVVGEVAALSIERDCRRRCARVEMLVREELELLISATVYKKATETLGAYYLEIDPGNPPATDLETALISDGGEIERVVETRSVDEVLDGLDR